MAKKILLFFILLTVAVCLLPAQTTSDTSGFFDLSGTPQWVRDMRRWEIVAFGSIPFTMLTAFFWGDFFRMSRNNWDFRYAPWPLKPAGAIAMDTAEMKRTITFAVSMSVAIAVADLVIVQTKRARDKRKAEAIPSNTTTIRRRPVHEEAPTEAQSEPDENEGGDDHAAALPAPP